MRFITLPAFILAASIVIADDGSTGSMQQPQMMSGYNASYRTEVDSSWDFFTSGSFTFWQPIQENMQLGVVSDSSGALDIVNGYEVDLSFKYKPGFKVAVGMNFDYDKWDSFIEYTWFRGTENASVNLDSNNTQVNLFPAWQIPTILNPQYNEGSEKWKLAMDLIDWDLARSYKVGEELYFHPFIGMRAAFMRQIVNVSYVNMTASDLAVWPSTYISQTARSWAIGPQVGLSTNWELGAGCRLYGDGELDILFTQYDLRSRQSSNVSTASYYIIEKNNANYLRAHTELALGFGWGSYFADNKWHVDLSADYGFQVFFNQNMFRSFVSNQAIATNTLPNGNLYIQGLTATIRLDF